MQSRPDGIHLYHSVKGTRTGCEGMGLSCIRHVATVDNGKTWSNSTMVLNQATVGHYMETFSGKWFPRLFGSAGGGMVLVTDGGPNNTLAPFMSYAPGASAMINIVSAAPGTITTHPPGSTKELARKGVWQGQMTFLPDAEGEVAAVSYTIWDGHPVPANHYKPPMGPVSQGYSHVVYRLENYTTADTVTGGSGSTSGGSSGTVRTKTEDEDAAATPLYRDPSAPVRSVICGKIRIIW